MELNAGKTNNEKPQYLESSFSKIPTPFLDKPLININLESHTPYINAEI